MKQKVDSRKFKKIMATIFILAMVFGCIPVSVFAEESVPPMARDGITNPDEGLFIVNFPGVEGVTMQYFLDLVWYSVDGTFNDSAVFNANGAASIRAVKGGMMYQSMALLMSCIHMRWTFQLKLLS